MINSMAMVWSDGQMGRSMRVTTSKARNITEGSFHGMMDPATMGIFMRIISKDSGSILGQMGGSM